MKKKDKKIYIINAVIVIAIFALIFISKGIFPFGNHSLIWGDMHDQITAFYYHFYDSFRGNSSLLIDFTTSGGVNFFGILCYYILSPITFILLLFPRENIYLAVSIVVALKVLLSSLTCLYFIRYYFKKLPSALSIFLALCYAFSGYCLSMYQITPWMDIMYLFPLLMIGFKKVLDLEKPTFYIILLTFSLICCFYVSVMVIIFLLLSAYVYLLVYKDKEERKKAILSLGISTILSLLMALFVLVPSYLQISVSSRLTSRISELLNSRTGPLTDKLSFFMFGGIVYLGILFLIKYHKKDSKFCLWYLATCLIVLIPVVVEPINKIWHFGSYAFFPYRFGFIAMFLLIVGACRGYSLRDASVKKKVENKNKMPVLSILLTMIVSAILICLTYRYYDNFQIVLDKLTISKDHRLLLVLMVTTFLTMISSYAIYGWTSTWNKVRICCIGLLTLTHITCNSFLYFGIDMTQRELMSQYEDVLELSKTYQQGNYNRVKNITSEFMMNSGMVMKYHTLDHFTSLTDRNNMQSLKGLGYSSMWVKTFSKGGTLFSDAILANRYLISDRTIENPYYQFVGKYGSLNFYELIKKPSYGYLIQQNADIQNESNSFERQNLMYQAIDGKNDTIFTSFSNWKFNNIKESKQENKIFYKIIDEHAYNFMEQTISIDKKQVLYLEILKDVDNNINQDIFKCFNIYVNDQLLKEHAMEENDNGVINLGTFENEEVNVKIELLGSMELDNITLATMDLEKYESFVENNNVPLKIKFHRNKISIEIDSEKEQMLFIPVSYNEGYRGKVNNRTIKVEKVFGNFLGIQLEKGKNEVQFTFTPPGLKVTAIISIVSLFLTGFLLSKNWYSKLLDMKWLQKFASVCYHFIYAVFFFGIYIGLTIVFILSYFIYF